MELSALFYDIGKWCGVIGFFCLSFLIFSGDTARIWDRWLGLDRIIKFQRKFSLFTALFVVLHPVFFIISNSAMIGGLIPNFTYIPLAVGTISLYIFILIMIASHFYKRVSYRMWQYIHVVTYILFGGALYHAFKWGSDATSFTPYYTIVLVAVVIGAIYRTQYKLRKLNSGKFTVKEVISETYDTFTLKVSPEKPFRFIAGQFAFLRLDGHKLHARHPFTISSAPHEDELRFTIKDSGRFTGIAKTLKPGDEILIDGPFGKFKARNAKNLVFIAGGVGITPFMSMIRANMHTEKPQQITLLYGSKTEADIIFKKNFDELQVEWFKKVYVLSNVDNASSLYEKGFIDSTLIKKYVTDIENSIFYICGPEIMKDNVKKTLADMGVPSKNVMIEDFFW